MFLGDVTFQQVGIGISSPLFLFFIWHACFILIFQGSPVSSPIKGVFGALQWQTIKVCVCAVSVYLLFAHGKEYRTTLLTNNYVSTQKGCLKNVVVWLRQFDLTATVLAGFAGFFLAESKW